MHTEAVTQELLETLETLMGWPELDKFCLVGGTSIALRHGYRSSDDIDLFTSTPYDSNATSERLRDFLDGCTIGSVSPGSITAFCRGIKLDILQHVYPALQPDESVGAIRMASLSDISAMKINALSRRGAKKDFSVLLYLHQHAKISLTQSVQNYTRKYGDEGLLHAVMSLTDFSLTKGEPDPRYLNGWTWDSVRKQMTGLGKDVQAHYNQLWLKERKRQRDQDFPDRR